MIRVYLDVCCLNRPFDDQRHDRIRLEAEAVLLILGQCESQECEWIASDVLDAEIEQTPDRERRKRVQEIASHATSMVFVRRRESARAREIKAMGFHRMDALHLACAETAGADVFLTTDDQLLRRAARFSGQLHVRVDNPLQWIRKGRQR